MILGVTGIYNHISFARDWLDRAEKKMREGFFVEGEVFLSLAEAEIRKAWEKSRSFRKKNSNNQQRKGFKLALTLVLVIGFIFAGFVYFQHPVKDSKEFELSLTEGYRSTLNYHRGDSVHLINVDFSINNYKRGN